MARQGGALPRKEAAQRGAGCSRGHGCTVLRPEPLLDFSEEPTCPGRGLFLVDRGDPENSLVRARRQRLPSR